MQNTSLKGALALVDGNALIHRAYHAYPQTLRTTKGELVNAVYGFIRLLVHCIATISPSYLVVAFDRKEPTFRHRLYDKYKAHRPEMDKELVGQLERLHEFTKKAHICSLSKAGYEADDIIGTVSQLAISEKVADKVFIVTGDMDCLQLVSDKVFVYAPSSGLSKPIVWSKEEVLRRVGILSSQIVDYKALRGDPSDNIPGVPGIGEKTAKELLSRWGSLEGIYNHLSELKSKSVSDKLIFGKNSAFMSKELATIRKDVPLTLTAELCSYSSFANNTDLKTFFEQMEFSSLIKSIYGKEEQKDSLEKDASGTDQLSFFS